MWNSVDAKGVDQVPVMGTNPYVVILFIIIVILICILFMNLFIAIVIETFNKEK